MKIQPTQRAVIDVGRRCPLRCLFCYYSQSGDFKSLVSKDKLKYQIEKAKDRGNKYIDFTGGEPMVHPDIVELVEFCSRIELQSCIITCGVTKIELWQQVIDAGLKDVLLSVHGVGEVHDFLVNKDGAYKKLESFIDFLNKHGMFWRTNTVITSKNYKQLPELARRFFYWNPKVVNFINFNPYYSWKNKEMIDIECRYTESSEYLKEAIRILEKSSSIVVNVRYYPFCMLKGYEKNVCNMLQVMFDPFEWDYGVSPKTVERFHEHGKHLQRTYCVETPVCKTCTVYPICGGPNSSYVRRYGYSELLPYFDQSIPIDQFYWRRSQREMPEYEHS